MLEFVNEIIGEIDWQGVIKTSIRIIIILVIAWVVMKVLLNFLRRLEKQLLKKSVAEGEPPTESEKRVNTLVRLLKQAALLALWLTAFLVVLREIGVEIGPIIAGAGIVGLAIGFGAQNLVRDFISGIFITMENQVRVGDVAQINGTGGLVEKINFRTIVLRDLAGVVHIFPNGSIDTLSNLTKEWSAYIFEIGVAYKEDTDTVIDIMKEIGQKLLEDSKFGKLMLEEPEIFGVDKFGDSAVVIKGRIKTLPIRQWAVGREFLRRVKYAFDENNIEIPFPHRTVYFGEESKPFDLQILEKYGKKDSSSE
ncbi:MAG: mechanosensitive ion channel family protein [Ignavibacteriae bacterium]|nr:mechanosensitive ion channel family protein [Ignavibacteriota bacterium]NOH00106.1 mechanosensitive ion channel family protein [Ignavibacteriota bacterium]